MTASFRYETTIDNGNPLLEIMQLLEEMITDDATNTTAMDKEGDPFWVVITGYTEIGAEQDFGRFRIRIRMY